MTSGNHMVDGCGAKYENDPLLTFAQEDAQDKAVDAIDKFDDALKALDEAYGEYDEAFGDSPTWAIPQAIDRITDALFALRRELGL